MWRPHMGGPPPHGLGPAGPASARRGNRLTVTAADSSSSRDRPVRAPRHLTTGACGWPQRGCSSAVRRTPHHAVVGHTPDRRGESPTRHGSRLTVTAAGSSSSDRPVRATRHLTTGACGWPQRGCSSAVRRTPHHAVVGHTPDRRGESPTRRGSRLTVTAAGSSSSWDRPVPRHLTTGKCGWPQCGRHLHRALDVGSMERG